LCPLIPYTLFHSMCFHTKQVLIIRDMHRNGPVYGQIAWLWPHLEASAELLCSKLAINRTYQLPRTTVKANNVSVLGKQNVRVLWSLAILICAEV
jgi:hypothetical protein